MKILGKVIEVFLPDSEEIMNVGFKIQIDNEIITIIVPQNYDNAKIYREDMVYLDEVIINNNVQYKIISRNNKDEVVNND